MNHHFHQRYRSVPCSTEYKRGISGRGFSDLGQVQGQDQDQGQGQDQKWRQRSALQQQMVLALTLTLVLTLVLAQITKVPLLKYLCSHILPLVGPGVGKRQYKKPKKSNPRAQKSIKIK